ncbi:MAG TPA: TraR/DksA family transcriptional regulator [Nitrospira sp.]
MTKRVRLREKLSRQPAALLTDWHFSLASPADRALYADPGDQASSDLEQDLAIQVRTRLIAWLKRIEDALVLMQTKHYGWCRRCRKSIPFARLAIQPYALLCVSCLARMDGRRE